MVAGWEGYNSSKGRGHGRYGGRGPVFYEDLEYMETFVGEEED